MAREWRRAVIDNDRMRLVERFISTAATRFPFSLVVFFIFFYFLIYLFIYAFLVFPTLLSSVLPGSLSHIRSVLLIAIFSACISIQICTYCLYRWVLLWE